MIEPPRVLWITPGLGALTGILELAQRGWPVGAAVLLRRRARGRVLLAEAERLRRAGVPVLISGRVDVARIAGVGAQLPERGVRVEDARVLLGDDVLIGRSCHDLDGLRAAATAGADYATLSPFAGTPGKGSPLGAAQFAAWARAVALPVLALGGVTIANVQEAVDAGAAGVAAIRGATAESVPRLCEATRGR